VFKSVPGFIDGIRGHYGMFRGVQRVFRGCSEGVPGFTDTQKIAGLFSDAKLFRKGLLKRKNRSVLYSAANCSHELHHNNLNSKVTLEHSVLVIINFHFF